MVLVVLVVVLQEVEIVQGTTAINIKKATARTTDTTTGTPAHHENYSAGVAIASFRLHLSARSYVNNQSDYVLVRACRRDPSEH